MTGPTNDLRVRHPTKVHLHDLRLVRLTTPDRLHRTTSRNPVPRRAKHRYVPTNRSYIGLQQTRQILLRQHTLLVHRLFRHPQKTKAPKRHQTELLLNRQVFHPSIHRHHHTDLLHRREGLPRWLVHAHHRHTHLTFPDLPLSHKWKKHLLRRLQDRTRCRRCQLKIRLEFIQKLPLDRLLRQTNRCAACHLALLQDPPGRRG